VSLDDTLIMSPSPQGADCRPLLRTANEEEGTALALLRAEAPMEVEETSTKRQPANRGNTEGTHGSLSPTKPADKKRRKAEPERGKPEAATRSIKDQGGKKGGG